MDNEEERLELVRRIARELAQVGRYNFLPLPPPTTIAGWPFTSENSVRPLPPRADTIDWETIRAQAERNWVATRENWWRDRRPPATAIDDRLMYGTWESEGPAPGLRVPTGPTSAPDPLAWQATSAPPTDPVLPLTADELSAELQRLFNAAIPQLPPYLARFLATAPGLPVMYAIRLTAEACPCETCVAERAAKADEAAYYEGYSALRKKIEERGKTREKRLVKIDAAIRELDPVRCPDCGRWECEGAERVATLRRWPGVYLDGNAIVDLPVPGLAQCLVAVRKARARRLPRVLRSE